MPHRLPKLVHKIADADSTQQVITALNEQVGPLRLLSVWHPDTDDIKEVLYHSGVPPRFPREREAALKTFGVSPMRMMVLNSHISFTHREAWRRLQPVGHDTWLWDLLQDHNMQDGFQTYRGNWVIAYWSTTILDGDRLRTSTRMALDAATTAAAYALNRLMPKKKKTRHVELSPRELTALEHLARGRRAPQIAKHMELSQRTVQTYLDRARKKLNATTATEAAVIAVRRKLI